MLNYLVQAGFNRSPADNIRCYEQQVRVSTPIAEAFSHLFSPPVHPSPLPGRRSTRARLNCRPCCPCPPGYHYHAIPDAEKVVFLSTIPYIREGDVFVFFQVTADDFADQIVQLIRRKPIAGRLERHIGFC